MLFSYDKMSWKVIPPLGVSSCEDLNLRGRTFDYGLVISNSENVHQHFRSCINNVIADRGGGSLKMITVFHKGGGGLAKLLQ